LAGARAILGRRAERDTEGVDMKNVLQLGFYVIGILTASFGAQAQWGDPAAVFSH
jgi:hypothetical protein